MMNKISSFTVIVTFVCLSLLGMALVVLLPVRLNPSRTLPGFTVGYSMPGSSSRVVEAEVTGKLEAMLTRIRGVKNIRSTSGNGYGRIQVELDRHTDVDMARFEASTVIRQTWLQLPDGVSYPTISMNVPDEEAGRPFLTYTLNAPSDPIRILRYAEENIKPRLARLEGVYRIELSGAMPMEWRLEYDSEQLHRLGITLEDIELAVQNNYRKEFLGLHHTDGGEWIRLSLSPGEHSAVFDPKGITVSGKDGSLIGLDELVTVTQVEEKPQGYYRINGLNSVYLSVTAEASANQLRLGEAIQHEMAVISAKLPLDYEIHTSYDATEYIRSELNKIYFRTGLTLLILMLFVWFTTRRLRLLFLIMVSLLVNMAVAIIFYYLFGLEMQLYSLAGITVSLNLMVDNTIVMADHIRYRHNLKAFLSVLAATLTTIGALVIVFFLDEEIRINLQDFATVVIVNLAVSLVVALFFVPALMKQIGLIERAERVGKGRIRRFRFAVWFNWQYARLIRFCARWRWGIAVLFVLAFGLPVFLLPERLEGEEHWKSLYNEYRPLANTVLGGTLRLFVEKVYEGSYFGRNDEVVLYANANLPNGSTLEQMNSLISRMEAYLSTYSEIRQFHTTIYNAWRASIAVHFKKEVANGNFPYTLKAAMISKALELGGGSWNIYGLQDQGFSNDVLENAGAYRIQMTGYNYDELYAWAEKLKERLMEHRRIKEVLINARFSWWKDDYEEFFFELDRDRMAQENIAPVQLFSSMRSTFAGNVEVGNVITPEGSEKIRLYSRQGGEYDVWSMLFRPYGLPEGKFYKLSEFATVKKGQQPQEVVKENQQYSLCLQYDYLGSAEMGKKVQHDILEEFATALPMGYTAEGVDNNWGWGGSDHKQFLFLFVVIAIIFFTTGILFNSLSQPLLIILMIPVSYIGVFLTFYLFRLNFDQGGFASFVLLCGITVNAAIYILNEYNGLRRRFPRMSSCRAYLKAWNTKIIPIFLTVVSTVLGFIPFLVGSEKEAFWFPLAAGTIGGLLMSGVALFFLLPLKYSD